MARHQLSKRDTLSQPDGEAEVTADVGHHQKFLSEIGNNLVASVFDESKVNIGMVSIPFPGMLRLPHL